MSDLNDEKEKDLERLKTLYAISKKLSVFTRVEESFAEILESAAECFPLSSAVLIEHWESKPHTAIWSSENVSKETISKAIHNAKGAYSYLAGATIQQTSELFNV